MNWYLKVLKEYVTFTGRARRKEFWMFTLFHLIIVSILVSLIVLSSDGFFSARYSSEPQAPSIFLIILLVLYILGTFLPGLAVTVRRLHDTNKSGWWYLISFVPYIGSFIILIFTCMDSYPRQNQWGENPKGIGNNSLIDQIGTE
ncbi:MAG: DUF805 domain-containing protein [Polaribacter sp.]|uniref:DUF805 domain-containing protein n=1 Tax=Polaribacter sp. TaxID=1920175 RepID=UPI003BAFFC17